MTSLRIDPVRTHAEHRAFCELPFALHRGDAHWVAPLRGGEHRRWDPRHNPSLRSRQTWRFLARSGGRVSGRIAAVVDQEFAARWERGSGFFGFFHCINDLEVARSLLAAAELALRSSHVERVIGPVDLTTHDEVGLLVDGFDSPPMILSPYHPPYYVRLLTEAGYQPLRDYHAYRWSPELEPSPAVRRLLRAAARTGPTDLRIRRSDPHRWSTEVRDLHRLYNQSFADVWGFVPISEAEFAARAAEFRRFYRPELAVFADSNGEPVGFGLALPDINEALAPLQGRLWPLGWWSLARGVSRIRGVRLILLGVRPQYRGRGVGARLAHALAEAARELGMQHAELSLVLDANRETRHLIDAFGANPVKTYRLYQRTL